MAKIALYEGVGENRQRVTFDGNGLQDVAELLRCIIRKWWRVTNFQVRVCITPGDHALIVEPDAVATDVQDRLLRHWEIVK